MFKLLTKYSKAIFFLALIVGTMAAYLQRIGFYPFATYVVDICLILCAVGLAFWGRK